MRRKEFLLFCSVVMTVVSACTQDHDTQPIKELEGEVSIMLSAEDVSPRGKAAIEVGVPDSEDFTVEIFKITDLGNVRLYKDTYENTKDKSIKLNCADYRLVAFHGDSLATGESMAYYEGVKEFSLVPEDRRQEIQVTAKVANVRVAVEYGENIQYDYTEYYSLIRSVTPGGRKKSVEFYQDETDKKAFVPYGTLYYELYAKVDGQWKYFPAEPVEPVKGDDITFKVDTKRLEGQPGINITIAQPENKEYSYDIPSSMLPQNAPQMKTSMPNVLEVIEGDVVESDMRMNLQVNGGIKECWLIIDSDQLSAEGVPEKLDLASSEIDPQVKATLERYGIRWMKAMAGNRFAYVDFSGLAKMLSDNVCDPSNLFKADFSLEVIDTRYAPGQTDHDGVLNSEKYSIMQGVPVPSISVSGFESGPVKILEGMGSKATGMKASVVAKGRIGHCYLNLVSPYMSAHGLPSSVDLSSVDAKDATLAQKLRDFGIQWPSDIASRTAAEIDFSGLVAYMDNHMYSSYLGKDFASISLEVKNEVTLDQTTNTSEAHVGDFSYDIPEATVSTIQDHNVWARRIYDFNVTLNKGNMQHVKFQYKAGDGFWTDVTDHTVLNGMTLACPQLTSLLPGIEYKIRAIYHDNEALSFEFSPVTTESETQLPDSGFESWVTKTFYYTKMTVGTGTGYRDWYIPGKSESETWWAVNSKRTMPNETNGNAGEETQPYKVFPTVSYSVNNHSEGSRSAQIMTIGIGNSSTGISLVGGDKRIVAGELFIGTADNDGKHTSEGHSFGARPSKVTFKYQYKSVDGEKFLVTVKLTLGNQTITKEYNGSHSDSWSTATIDLTEVDGYCTSGTPKATDIYISFKSTGDSSPKCKLKQKEEVAGTTYNLHRGSVLRVDDIKLIYE